MTDISLNSLKHWKEILSVDALQMALYVAASVIVGIMAVWSGMMLSSHLIRGIKSRRKDRFCITFNND